MIYQLVREPDIAYHAGESIWKGVPHVNYFSIGIELVNANDGIMEYPAEQLATCAELVADICKDRDIKLENVMGHKDIAPGRKTDPAEFPWDNFRSLLKDAGIS